MEQTIGDRFSKLIEALRTNKSAFAKSIGKSHTMVGTIIEGKNKPGFDVIEAIVTAYPNVNTDWLIKGEGEMLKQSANSDPRNDGYLMQYLQSLEQRVQEQSAMIRTLTQQLGKPEVVLAYAASCAFFLRFGYNFGYNLLTGEVK
ncbi:hypothetical protein ACS5NO_17370 [Larkinella sp. GY13]|uniref:hypothetical protein n=1 Tax=Larkinella sp. GY13 TaxID=3453720 RepID=UPI003EEF3F3F